jgi:hypothetical protein
MTHDPHTTFTGESRQFVPSGARCEADDGRGSDFGTCSGTASAVVTDDRGRDRYVCTHHELYWLRAQTAALRQSLAQLTEERNTLQRNLAIANLAVPLEDDLSASIDEMLKYLSMEQGYTLNGIARLLIECQKRMAADWLEIGRLRRESKERDTLRTALVTYAQHKPDCACVSHRRSDDGGVTFKFPPIDCTCGLSATLATGEGD